MRAISHWNDLPGKQWSPQHRTLEVPSNLGFCDCSLFCSDLPVNVPDLTSSSATTPQGTVVKTPWAAPQLSAVGSCFPAPWHLVCFV